MEDKLLKILEGFAPIDFSTESNPKIYHDLGIYGDDAAEFLKAYSKAFNVDLSTFIFDEYFPPEVDVLTSVFLKLFRSRKIHYKELTVKMLLESAHRGTFTE